MEKPKLLIIDDDEALCESLRDTIELEGYVTVIARTGRDGIKKVKNNFYNIVLLDMKLPDSNGIEVLEKIKEISSDTEVVMFTAYAATGSVIEAMDRNAFSFLPKPFEIPDLISTLKKACEKQALIFENRRLFQQISDGKRDWENTFDSISDPISIHDMDSKITRCNKALTDKLNIKPEDIVGKKCYEIYHGRNEPMPECPLSGGGEILKPLQLEMDCFGGTFLLSGYPRFDKLGKLNGIVHIARDITEKKLAEQALSDSEERFRTISATANDAIIMSDNEGIISYWNHASEIIFGYSTEEALGKKLYEVCIPEKYVEAHLKGFDKFKDTGHGDIIEKTTEISAVRKDGTEFPIEISISVVKLKDKWCAIGIIRDITERLRAEYNLRISYKMASLGRLTAGVFHEILNPVNIISSHIQLLLMGAEKGSTTEKDLKSVQEEVLRIVKITDGLLRFSRTGTTAIENVDINDLLERTISIVEPDMKLDNVTFIRLFADRLPQIAVNSNELRQVFLNLITNAGDAMPEDGTITISTTYKGEGKVCYVRILVADTGCGIDKDQLEKVFEPFFTTKKEGKGTGLGLSISYSIIESHGGNIMVKSVEGKGTTFMIDLPVKT